MAMDALTMFDEYVAWYLWAAATADDDAIACHTAATAAVHALSVGASRDQAAAEARAAARNEAALQQTRSDYGPNHRYVDWFLWARSNLHLPEARCHEAARAAVAET